MKYFKKIEEKRIYLSPVVKDDALLFAKWLNDEEVTAGLHTTHTITTEDSAEEMLESIIDKKKPSFEIILKEDDRAIGSVILTSVNELDRTATIGVYIGEKEYRGKGYGTEALRAIIRYGFDYLNLHNINLSVISYNENALRCYQKLGFQEYGRRHECVLVGGKYYDRISLELLEQDYRKLSLQKV